MRVRDRRCTTVHVLGRSEPLLVLEAPSVVASRLGGGMAVLHVPGSWLELGPAEVQVLVAACHVSLVEPSSFRIQSRRLTNVHLPQSVIMQVFEDIPTVARILGL